MSFDTAPYKLVSRDTHRKVTKINSFMDVVAAMTDNNLRGLWDASSGSFPGGGTAQEDDYWQVSDPGTVDGVAFAAGDRAIAIVDNASTGTYAANWIKVAAPTVDIAAVTHAATGKTTPVDADELALVDSAASNALKKLTWANLKATLKTYFDTLYEKVATAVHAATGKSTPVDADEIGLVDSAASNVLKKLTWANVKATLKTYFDTLYQAALVSGTNIKTVNGTTLLGSGDVVVGGTDVLLATLTPTAAANVDALTVFTSSYDYYQIVIRGVLPAADDIPRIRFAVAGSVDTSSVYGSTRTEAADQAMSAGYLSLTATDDVESTTTLGLNAVIDVVNANATTAMKSIFMLANWGSSTSATGFKANSLFGGYRGTSAITGFRLFWASGTNFQAAGKVLVYGFKNT